MSSLKEILIVEGKRLEELLVLLDKQYKLILNKDVFNMEAITEEIQLKNKEVAEAEVQRRKFLGNTSLREYVNNSKDSELDEVYRAMQRLLNELILQKDTNELLIKQQLAFTNKLLNIMNPKKDAATYNSYGNIKR
ncbi:MAG: flagellar protein FlgN [Clostridium sp.]|uniref:flagellar protein FlgN n=1 Tax=Clostridium sp. TaxID=1506 RepID=UPI0029067FAE|nr:flagellar protein FlgN [Clostridium sp.]MDU5110481.1 flagellar protein FlgN [Clostridium sp.]